MVPLSQTNLKALHEIESLSLEVRMVARLGAQKFAFWMPNFWKSDQRFGTISGEEVALVLIQNKAAAEMVPVSAEAEHALVEQFAQMAEHCMNGA